MSVWSKELRATARLAVPIIAVQFGQYGLGLVDVLLVGNYSDSALAGITLGHTYLWALLVFGHGVLAALDPVVAQAVGAHDEPAIRSGMQRGCVLSVILGIPLMALCSFAGPALELLQQPPSVVPLAADYVMWSLPGIVPYLLFVAFRQSLQAMSRIRPVLIVMFLANALNVVLSWGLIHGNLGLPELGLRGAAIASSICRIWMAVGVAWAAWPVIGRYLRGFERSAWHPRAWGKLFAIGLPLGLQFSLEFGAFAVAVLLIGRFGEDALAGHMVGLKLATLSFMLPVGISSAAAVRVGQAVGRNDPDGVRRAAVVTISLGASIMAVFGALFLTMPRLLASPFTGSEPILAIAASLVPLAGVFQVFDGVQVVCVGVLRGLAETKTAMWVNVIGFWVLGIPTGYILVESYGFGPAGVWWGLVVGLAVVAIILAARVAWRLTRTTNFERIESSATTEPNPT